MNFISISSRKTFKVPGLSRVSWFSAAAPAKKSKQTKTDGGDLGYFERKKALKSQRRMQYNARLERKSIMATRREGSTKNVLKSEFDAWFSRRRASEEQWDRQARQQGKAWNIEVAVVVERPPKVLPDLEPWETDFDELRAYLAQFGKEYPKEFSSEKISSKPIPVTDEDLIALLPKGYQPAPRETAADASGATDTLERKLKDRLFLRIDGDWPRTSLEGDESLSEAAQRLMKSLGRGGSKSLDLYFVSAAPVAVQMKKSENEEDDVFGTKTFFLRVQHDEGDVKGSVAWLDRAEIVEQESSNEDSAKFLRYLL